MSDSKDIQWLRENFPDHRLQTQWLAGTGGWCAKLFLHMRLIESVGECASKDAAIYQLVNRLKATEKERTSLEQLRL